jgi:hypothetical protein
MKRIALLALLMALLVAGCRTKSEPMLTATPTPMPPPLGITYCDIEPSDMCLEGFGLDIDERLLVLFKADDRFFADIYILADGPDGEMVFECQQSENFLENVYCLGDEYPEGESIKLNIYSNMSDRLIALGVFEVQYSDLLAPDVVFGVDATPTPAAEIPVVPTSTPVPSYSNPTYPNPSYPNLTSTP